MIVSFILMRDLSSGTISRHRMHQLISISSVWVLAEDLFNLVDFSLPWFLLAIRYRPRPESSCYLCLLLLSLNIVASAGSPLRNFDTPPTFLRPNSCLKSPARPSTTSVFYSLVWAPLPRQFHLEGASLCLASFPPRLFTIQHHWSYYSASSLRVSFEYAPHSTILLYAATKPGRGGECRRKWHLNSFQRYLQSDSGCYCVTLAWVEM